MSAPLRLSLQQIQPLIGAEAVVGVSRLQQRRRRLRVERQPFGLNVRPVIPSSAAAFVRRDPCKTHTEADDSHELSFAFISALLLRPQIVEACLLVYFLLNVIPASMAVLMARTS